jgi:hypothetical protein
LKKHITCSKIQAIKEEIVMAKNKRTTSPSLASKAAKALRSKRTSNIGKTLAGGVLSQAASGKQTGASMEEIAANVLRSEHYSDLNRSFAASLVSQSNKER